MNVVALHNAVAAVCPIVGVSVVDPADKTSWTIDFDPSATVAQQLAAQQVLAAFPSAAQQSKSQALSAACAAQIMGGYQSAALGAVHTYPSGPTDQSNMTASVLASLLPNLPSTWTTPFWCADANGVWAWVPHNAAQIQQAGSDGKVAILAAQARNAQLQAQVAAATTPAAIDAVTW